MKDYKKILEGVVNIIATTEKTDIGFAHICSYLSDNCDELFESEDEKIKKELKRAIAVALDYSYFGKETADNCIAWLEKQGEKKSILCKKDIAHIDSLLKRLEGLCRNEFERTRFAIREDEEWLKSLRKKIFTLFSKFEQCKQEEPKFKVGDWVIDKQGIIHQIANVLENVTNHTYGYDIVGGGYFNDNTEGLRLWTLADAKDGDVISNGEMIVIFKKFEEPSYKQHIVAYIGLDTSNDIQITDDTWNFDIDKAKPATKEQCDLLFTKMKEVWYEWDAEKKELTKMN